MQIGWSIVWPALLALSACASSEGKPPAIQERAEAEARLKPMKDDASYPVTKTETEWKEELGAERYRILRERGTERAFTGALLDNKKTGVYTCGACGQELFSSSHKFDSGSGWPSFFDVIAAGRVATKTDTSHGMVRTEILCSRCGSHLGHVFEDGPAPTGLRHCVNSASLSFEER